MDSSHQRSQIKAYGALAIGLLGLSLSPLFVRFADAPGIVTSYYRMLIATIALAPFAIRMIWRMDITSWKILFFPMVAGVFTTIDHGLWSTAIDHTTVANATLLNYISPLWVALFTIIVWKEKLAPLFWLGLFATLAGASAVLGSTIIFTPTFKTGDILAVFSSFFYAGYYLVTQKGRSLIDTLPYLWMMTLTSTI
jgi:drug/metabolite transporter (DMT)-like permease